MAEKNFECALKYNVDELNQKRKKFYTFFVRRLNL